MRLKKRNLFFMILRIVVIFFAVVIVAAIIALSRVNLETLRGQLVSAMRAATGMPVEIDGAVSWKFSIRPKVEINKVRIPNAEWATHKNGLTADKVDVSLDLISILRGRPAIQNVKIYDAELFAEKNDAGVYSIYPAKTDDAVKSGGKFPFKDFGFESIELRNFKAHINKQKYSIDGFRASFDSKRNSREYDGWIKLESNPKPYPFIIALSEYNSERKIYPIRIALSDGADALVANVALEGTSLAPIDFIVKGAIRDINSIDKFLNIGLPTMPQINLNIAGGFGNKKMTLRKSNISMGGAEITISGDVDWSGDITNINANIKAADANLYQMFPELYPNGTWVRPNRPLHIFKHIPLPGSVFGKYNLNLDLQVGKLVVYRDLKIEDINISAKLKDAKMRMDGRAKFAAGDIQTAADIHANKEGILSITAAGIGERVYLGEILTQVRETDLISELPMNFEFYLRARGADLDDIMSTITGPVYIYSVAKGYVHSALVSYMYGTDFLTDLRHNIQDLFASEKKYNQMTISCAAANVKLRDGVVETTNGVALESNALNVRMAGGVNLGAESINASVITTPTRGLKLSLTGSLVNSMAFTGNLAEPDMHIDGAAVMGKVAAGAGLGLLLAPLTGGLSLVAGAGIGLVAGDMLENWLSDPNPCKTAMDKGAPNHKGDPEWMARPMSELVRGMISVE